MSTIPSVRVKSEKTLLQLMAGSSLGTILEWYDFSLFAFFSPVLAKLFFPQEKPLLGLMLTYAIFAVGYFFRPLGAFLFGHWGDRFGRKKTLISSILLMSLPTFLIGCLPTYASIGIAAPLLMIALRICQGISAGGESTGALLFVMESVPEKQRGFWGSCIWSMTGVGMLLGSFAVFLVSHFATVAWAWRVPFLLGLLTGVIGYLLRRNTDESVLFAEHRKNNPQLRFPLWTGWRHHKKSLFLVIGFYLLSAMITYLVFVFMPIYATTVVHFPLRETTLMSTLVFAGSAVLIPLAGLSSDYWGSRRTLFMAALGLVLFSYLLFTVIAQGVFSYFVGAELVFLVIASLYQGSLAGAVFELVPTSVRYSVIAVGYNVSYSLFGGTAPFIATYLVDWTGNKAAPGGYLMLGAFIALLTLCFLPPRLKPDLAKG